MYDVCKNSVKLHFLSQDIPPPPPEDTCYAGGECLYFFFANESANNPRECADLCDAADDLDTCTHFTHYAGSQQCLLYLE